MITVEHLTKRFGDFLAVNDVSFDVSAGEIFAFLGPNGAGKTTTIRTMVTLLSPSSGRITIDGLDLAGHQDQIRKRIGIVFQDPSLDQNLTAWENMDLHGALYGVPRRLRRERAELLLRAFELWESRREVVLQFSGGMRRRLEIARGLLHTPRILFLDEPTLGLDPQTRNQLWTQLKQLNQSEGVTVFLTTHYMDEAENCDRIAIIDHGKIVAIDTPENLKASVGKDRVQIRTADDQTAIAELKERFELEAAIHEGMVTFNVESGEQFVPRLFEGLSQQIKAVSVSRPSLDDVFMSYTGKTIRDAEATVGDRNRAHVMAFRRGR